MTLVDIDRPLDIRHFLDLRWHPSYRHLYLSYF